MKMNTLYAALAGALLLGTSTLAPAAANATMSRDEYKAEKERIEADAKGAKAKCKGMNGNAKDICEAEAKAHEKVAKKELEYKRNPTDRNQQDVEKIKAEAAYEVAKEKCEDQKGAEQSACKKQAKADKDKAMADVKAKHKTVADSTTSKRATTGATTDTGAARSGSTAGNTGGTATTPSK